jgi:hypothetical protein
MGMGKVEASAWKIGRNYFIRSVTHHYTGCLVSVDDKELVLKDAAWIADDGRFAQAVKTGEFAEVEPYPDGKPVIIGRGAVLDAVEIPKLPREQK